MYDALFCFFGGGGAAFHALTTFLALCCQTSAMTLNCPTFHCSIRGKELSPGTLLQYLIQVQASVNNVVSLQEIVFIENIAGTRIRMVWRAVKYFLRTYLCTMEVNVLIGQKSMLRLTKISDNKCNSGQIISLSCGFTIK